MLHRISLLVQEERLLKTEKKRRGENYNIFETMHAQSNEVHTHSAILASLLNPEGNHGCRSSFLSLFVNKLAEVTAETASPVIFDTDLQEYRVYVERSIGKVSSDCETGGRLDIVVESADNKGKAIIIENKIYASDTYKQLYRYKNYADERYGTGNYVILYLTLDGHKPEDGSISGRKFTMKEDKEFHCISYRTFIYEWLECCKEKAASIPIVRETITQYYNLIAKLTNQNMETSTKEELVALLANKENIAAVFKIKDVYNDVINEVLNTTLLKQVQEIAKELEMECRCSPKNWYKRWNGQFFFSKPEWRHFCIGFEFMGNDLTDFNYGIRYKSETEKGKAQDIKQEIQDIITGGLSNTWWASYKPFKYRHWNNDMVFEHLYNGKIKTEIKQKVICLRDNLKAVDL